MQAQPDVQSLHRLAELLRIAAREEILPRFRRTEASSKADGSLVTEADYAVQRRIADACAEHFPGIPMLGEEMTAAEQASLIGDGRGDFWCLDPLDGTSNFTCGFPGFSISLALVREGRAELGVILDPIRNQCFTAARGHGAHLDGKPIGPYAPNDDLADCLAMIDFKRLPSARIPGLLAPGAFRSQRNLGSVALEWCWLAAGRFQLYLHGGQNLWDHVAGRLIAHEAGVPSALFAQDGSEPIDTIGLDKRLAVAAANASLYEQWLEFVDLPMLVRGKSGSGR